jgi:hypothetical protein
MSGNVEQVDTNRSISSLCPIVINPNDNIITYVTALTVSQNYNVQAGYAQCLPTSWAYNQVYTVAQAGRCCSIDTYP